MTFVEAINVSCVAMRGAGYGRATIEVHIHPEEVFLAQRERVVAEAIIKEAIRPTAHPVRAGSKFLGMIGHVALYVREEATI